MSGSGDPTVGQAAAEQALAASERRFRLLADNASDVVFQAGPDRLATWVAPAITRVLGWRPEELVGTTMMELVHPDDVPHSQEVAARAYAGELVEPEPLTLRARTTTGTYRWLSGHGASLFDGETFVGIVVSLRDVDDLVRAREAAEEERIRVRATMDSLFDPHVVVEARRDDDGAITDLVYLDANDAACAELRRPRAELVGALVSSVLTRGVVSDTLDVLTRVLDTGSTLVLDDVAMSWIPDGSTRQFDIRAVRVGDALSVTWRDVSERHAAMRAVAESERRFRLLSEQLEDLLAHGSVLALRARADGEIVWVSRSVSRLLGYDPAAALGTKVQFWVHPDDLGALGVARRSLSADGTPMPLQLRLRATDGTYRTFDGMAFRADDLGGRRQLFQVTMADVTERAVAGRLREQLVAIASHELRSPLAFILGSLRLIQAGIVAPESERGRDLLERVTSTSERVARIADSLLRLQHLELTPVPAPSERIDVAAVVRDAAATVPVERGVTVVCDRARSERWWRADADEVTQAVVNLAVNAVKHSPDGGVVHVGVGGDEDAVRISVRDHGPGVPAEHRSAVFEAFHQLERSDRRGGVGLGLAIVAKIAERHAGRVWVEDAPGGGACFVLELGRPPLSIGA